MSMIKKFLNLLSSFQRFGRLNKKILQLNIESAGLDDEGDAYIKLLDGPIFFSIKTVHSEHKYYSLLPKSVKANIPLACYHTALDIIIRYIEGGLKFEGPKKERKYSVKPGDIVAEMGAYMGHYSIYLSEKIGQDGKLIAIEPIKDNVRLLKKNIEANKIRNTIIVPLGVWKEKTVLDFYRKKGDQQSSSILLAGHDKEKMELAVDSLDNILAEHKINIVNFMIIQLNGAEIEALEGLKNITPDNIAIAARYNKGNVVATDIISSMLEVKDYQVDIIEKHYLYAKKLIKILK